MLRWLRQYVFCRHRVVLVGFASEAARKDAQAEAWKRCLACGRVGWNYVLYSTSDYGQQLPWLYYF